MFHDIQSNITNNVERLRELKKLHPDGQLEGKEVFQKGFFQLRSELDVLVKDSANNVLVTVQNEAPLQRWVTEDIRDIVSIHAMPENVEDYPDTISRYRVIKTDVPGQEGGKPMSKATNIRKITLLNDVKTKEKENKKAPALLSTSYPFRIGFSIELQGKNFDSPTQSEYRDRDRRSYGLYQNVLVEAEEGNQKYEETKILQIDTTVVKENSNSQTKKTLYEIEVELLVEYDEASEKILMTVVEKVLKIVNQTRFLYTLEEVATTILNINMSMRGSKNTNAIQTGFVNKPEDLMWDDLRAGNASGIFPNLVAEGQLVEPLYTVTVKLDGMRMLVYFGENGVYLFNPLAGIICKISEEEVIELTGSILDGELIIGEKDELHNAKLYEMYLFDCLRIRTAVTEIKEVAVVKGKETKRDQAIALEKQQQLQRRDPNVTDMRMNKHVIRRKGTIHAARKCLESKIWNDNVRLVLFTKKFYPIVDRETFYVANNLALNKVVIRTPSGEEKETTLGSDGLVFTNTGEYLPETGSKNKRWKPPHQLTIDFRVLMIDDRDHPNNKIGIPAVFVQKGEREGKGIRQVPFHGTVENRFDSTSVELENVVNGFHIKILEDQIAEFRYDTRRHVFVPLRPRYDKSQPNRIKAAIDTWKLIQNPIQRGIMTGTILGARVLDLMRSFHNNFKAALLDTVADQVRQPVYAATPQGRERNEIERPILFDIGSGEGGFIVQAWKYGGKKGRGFNVVALEPQPERVAKLRERLNQSKMQDRSHILLGDARETKKIVRQITTLYGNRKVDAVSMFHVLTFFYDFENSVSALLSTIKGVLRPGGIFVCMALDGDLVYEQMKGAAQIKLPGIMIRMLPVEIVGGKGKEELRSRAVRVQISTPKDISLAGGQKEYLVDFNHFITQFEANGFELSDDRYLNAEAILNDSEMWWSQMTRVVKFRYVGVDQPKKDSLNKLKDILMKAKARSYPLLPVGEFQRLAESSIPSIFSAFELWTVGVLGDGSCFLHALLYAVNSQYRTMNTAERVKLVSALRRDLAALFTRDVYESLSDGSIAELGQDVNSFSYDVLKYGLLDYGHWFGLEFLQFVSNAIKINIQLVWWRDGKIQIYKSGSEKQDVFIKGRNTVILFWQGEAHFQPVGRKLGEDVGFVFQDDDPLSKLFQ